MHLRTVVHLLLVCTFFLSQPSTVAQISLNDDLARVISLTSTPTRIISLAPSITETLFSVGAGKQVAGVTDYCNYPAEARQKPHVGGVINPSIETIISLAPDLIILSMEGNVREDFAKLVSLGIPVFVTNPRNLSGIYKSISDLGRLTGHSARAETLVTALKARERTIAAPMHLRVEQKVMLIVSLQPLIVAGSRTFIAELMELAGGLNIARTSPGTYPTYSRESVVAENPDVIIAMSDAVKSTAELLEAYPEWAQLSAVKNQKVFRIDSDIISRPGPRALEGLEALHSMISFNKGK